MIFHKYKCKTNPHEILSKIQQHIIIKWGISQECKLTQHSKINWCNA